MDDSVTAFAADLKDRLDGSVRQIGQRAHFGKTTIGELTSGKRLPHEKQLERLLLTAPQPPDAAELAHWQKRRAAVELTLAAERDRADAALILTDSAHLPTAEVCTAAAERTHIEMLIEDSSASGGHAQHAPSRRRTVLLISFVNLMVLLISLLVVDVVTPEEVIAGTVRCADGSPVVGIYVTADASRSGFATRRRLESTSHVRFSYVLGHGGPWLVTAGCGGTTQVWATDSRALDVVDADWQDWVCVPVPKPAHGLCSPAPAV